MKWIYEEKFMEWIDEEKLMKWIDEEKLMKWIDEEWLDDDEEDEEDEEDELDGYGEPDTPELDTDKLKYLIELLTETVHNYLFRNRNLEAEIRRLKKSME